MSARRERIGEEIKSHCCNKKRGDLLHIMETLEGSFPNYRLVAVHIPSDRIVFGEEYVDAEYSKVLAEEAQLVAMDRIGTAVEH